MNTHAVFEFENTTNIPSDKVAFQLVSEISEKLHSKGIKCRKVTPGCFCPGFVCEIDKTHLDVGIYDSWRYITKTKTKGGIFCRNAFPSWKHLFHRYTDEELHSGRPLERLIGIVQEIIAADSRYVDVRWMSEQEFNETFLCSPDNDNP